ncbi:unnamed protein product [Moneuplotes crassus]|uniref:Uncharacterized protein n=1 Tax=Euplotes crassus TaxID=5936 RepID=A0AAD1UAX7_EUPCR|nr:unnamed protein product [Moneuplotes crassus]
MQKLNISAHGISYIVAKENLIKETNDQATKSLHKEQEKRAKAAEENSRIKKRMSIKTQISSNPTIPPLRESTVSNSQDDVIKLRMKIDKLIFNRKKKEQKLRDLQSKLDNILDMRSESDSSDSQIDNVSIKNTEPAKTGEAIYQSVITSSKKNASIQSFLSVDNPELGMSQTNMSIKNVRPAPKKQSLLPFKDRDKAENACILLDLERKTLLHMKQRIQQDLDFTRRKVSGSASKTGHSISQESKNIDKLCEHYKRISLLKHQRDHLKRKVTDPEKGSHRLKMNQQSNALKIELAIETNQVEELLEKVVTLTMKTRDSTTSKSKSILDISSSMMGPLKDQNSKLSLYSQNKKNRDLKKDSISEADYKETVKNMAMIVPMFNYLKSKNQEGTTHLAELHDNPEFNYFKRFYLKALGKSENAESRLKVLKAAMKQTPERTQSPGLVRRRTIFRSRLSSMDDNMDVYLNEIQKMNQDEISPEDIIDVYTGNQSNAMSNLYEKTNQELMNKNIELGKLKEELAKYKEAYFKTAEIQEWLEKKEVQENKKIQEEGISSEISTINAMKMKLLYQDKPKTSDYLERSKDAARIGKILQPQTFVLNVSCTFNEILRNIAYKLWKIHKITNANLPEEILELIDLYEFTWKEDLNFYHTKEKDAKNEKDERSQRMVEFFLAKLKRAAEKTYLELIRQQKDENLLMQGLNNFASVSDSLTNVKFNSNKKSPKIQRKPTMIGLQASPEKQRNFTYTIRVAKFVINALLKLTRLAKATKDPQYASDLPNQKFNNEYQIFQLVENQVHKNNVHHTENMNRIRKVTRNQPTNYSSKGSRQFSEQEEDFLHKVRRNAKTNKQDLKEIDSSNGRQKEKKDIVDLRNINQYTGAKIIRKLKDFERKELKFHTALKKEINKFHSATEIEEKPAGHHEILYLAKKKQKTNKNLKTNTKNKDLHPVSQAKKRRSSSMLRIKKRTKIKPRLSSATNSKPRRGRNSSIQTTISSFITKSKRLKPKAKKKLPSIKLSFDFDTDIPIIKSVTSKYTIQDINLSSEFSKIGPIKEENSPRRLSKGGEQSFYSQKDLRGKPAKTQVNFFNKPPKPKHKVRPISGYIDKPPVWMR